MTGVIAKSLSLELIERKRGTAVRSCLSSDLKKASRAPGTSSSLFIGRVGMQG